MGESESYVSSSHTVAELKACVRKMGYLSTAKSRLIGEINRHFSGDDEPDEEEMISLRTNQSLWKKK